MFSQFRHAVEDLAPPTRRSIDDTTVEACDAIPRSTSLDSPIGSAPASSSKLAESALTNLRKSLATQRSGSVGSIPKSTNPIPKRDGRTKLTLEDRLRAATSALAENSTTSISRKQSPPITSPVSSHPLSPSSDSLTLSQNVVAAPISREVTNLETTNESLESAQLCTTYSTESHSVHSEEPLLPIETGSTVTGNSQLFQPPHISINVTHPLVSGMSLQTAQTSESQSAIALFGTAATSQEPHPSTYVEAVSASLHPAIVRHSSEEVITGAAAVQPSPTNSGVALSEDLEATSGHNPVLMPPDSVNSGIATICYTNSNITDIGPYPEELQEKLRKVEQRFTDVSTSFKRLQAEKQAADMVLRDLTPLESLQDSMALREYLQNLTSNALVFQDEIKRLNGKLEFQEDQIEELRDTHRLESSLQGAQIEKLQVQVFEAEALIKAAQSADTQAEEAAAEQKNKMEHLQKETECFRALAKEEEEKRVKAISLLKTVRQKLVKAEKERDDVSKDIASWHARGKAEKENEHEERVRLHNELVSANAEKETFVANLKAQSEKDLTNLKEQHEKELIAIRGQYELEGAANKNAHLQEIGFKDSQLRSLQQSLALAVKDKNTFFEDLQLRQAELESAQSHLELLESQNTEYQYQLRELGDRFALLKDDFVEAQREQESKSREPVTSADEVARLLSSAEARYEAKIFDLKKNFSVIEQERNNSEADWSRKLREKTREVEELKRLTTSVTRMDQQHEEAVSELHSMIEALRGECRILQEQLHDLRQSNLKNQEADKALRLQEQDLNTRIAEFEQLVEEGKLRESQLRFGNKTLREELRKVQSSVALLEKQRNPGVGYWTSHSVKNSTSANQNTIDSGSSRVGSPQPLPENAASEEEVNLEYLRNVILQFLEHKEMRPNLVKVLSIILHFTPQETRRLVAKV